MDVDCRASLRAGAVTVDGADAELLRAVDETGSLNAAADQLERSYSRAHKRLTELEEELGPLVERERGGSGGGGSVLTDRARDLLARFGRVRAVLDGTASADEVVLSGEVTERAGELVTVETAPGVVRALAAGDVGVGQHVDVTLTADAVTLHDPTGSPTAGETSARNRLGGTVQRIERRNAVATVTVAVGPAQSLSVLVTAESVDRLSLESGSDVVATFKATAARATPKA